MEGEKERERERGEEKESDETEEDDDEEEDDEDAEGAALVWQEGSYGEDDLGLPIMHWEALSLRIAELEKQEEEKREKKTKSSSVLGRGKKLLESWPLERDGGESKESWEDGGEAEDCNSRVTALTSRLSNQMNLQLCFINDSGSEEEEEDSGETICAKNSKMVVKNGSNGSSVQVPHQPQSPAATKSKSSGFKAALSALKNRLRMEQKQQSLACGDQLLKNGKLDCRDLQAFSLKELNTHRNSLNKAIQDLSTELVVDLQTRDQLRTEQDAMLLEVQGMTSL